MDLQSSGYSESNNILAAWNNEEDLTVFVQTPVHWSFHCSADPVLAGSSGPISAQVTQTFVTWA